MPTSAEHMVAMFKDLLQGALVEQDVQKTLALLAEDVIGIGMGAQGTISCKADVARILGDTPADPDQHKPELEYSHLESRCYDEKYGTVCGILKIKTQRDGKTMVSTLGQLMSFRKDKGKWMICAIQATPLFERIEELEAYPIKFAQDILKSYRQQEEIAYHVQNDNIGVYLINFTKGIFEHAITKSNMLVCPVPGAPYEKIIFEVAKKHLSDDAFYEFITTFSQGNILNTYQSGKRELAIEHELLLPARKTHWIKIILKLSTDKNSNDVKGYLYIVDIDTAKKRELELQSEAELDPLTKLYNKAYAEIKITEKLKTISESSQGAFFILDLDFFKKVNDTHGHQEGDRVLRETANGIKTLIRKDDIAGRLGGDEFCIYFQGELTQEAIVEKAQMLCGHVRSLRLSPEAPTSCSIGIVFCATPDLPFAVIYDQADKAMYAQKEKGRNGYTVYA